MSSIVHWLVIVFSEAALDGCFCEQLIESHKNCFQRKFFNKPRFYSIYSDIGNLFSELEF